jgi:hypothetical protein
MRSILLEITVGRIEGIEPLALPANLKPSLYPNVLEVCVHSKDHKVLRLNRSPHFKT